MLVAKYKFDKSIYEDFMPIFNGGYEGYTVTDEIDSENSNHVIRTIECDTLPTMMRFGREWVSGETNTDDRTDSLLEILDMNTSGLTSCSSMFRFNTNLTSINCNWDVSNITKMYSVFTYCYSLTSLDVSKWDTSKVISMYAMFNGCKSLTSLDVSNWNTSNVSEMNNMFYQCTNLTSLDVSNWNTSNVTNMTYMFYNCQNITSLDVSKFDTSNVTNMNNMFQNCTNLTLLDVSKWDTGKVTTMGYMFDGCKSLTQLDVSNWNTSNVNNMSAIFSGCQMTKLNVSNWDTSKVTDMSYMFGANSISMKLTSLDISNFNTSNVTDMHSMFQNCQNLTSLDVSNFDTSNVTRMGGMFSYCNKLTTLDISNWDTSKVTDMSHIFNNTSSLQYIRCNNTSTINTLASLLYNRTSSTQGKIITTSSTNVDTTTLSSLNWSVDTSSGTKIAEYVYDKSIWNYLVPEFNEGYSGYFVNDRIEDESKSNIVTRELIGYGGLPTLMRFGCRLSTQLGGPPCNIPHGNMESARALLEIIEYNSSYINNYVDTFRYCENLKFINLQDVHLTSPVCMFEYCTSLTSLDVSNWNTSNATSINYMFNNCKSLTSIDLSNWNTSNVTGMNATFKDCSSLTSITLGNNFDTSKVTNMLGMFYGCNNLTQLDVSNFDTSNVTDMQYMFRSCQSLASLDVSNWDTSNVTNMDYMFYWCQALTSLDVSNWNTSNVTTMNYMFHGCQSLTSIDASKWDISKINYLYTIFADCISLTSLNLSNWNVSNIKDLRYLITNCGKLKTLDISNWNFNSSISFTQNFENTPLLTDIGMLYCSQDTVNKIIPLITDGSKIIWVKDTNASDYTVTDYVTIKDYKEDNRALHLNSPLLEGDEIVNKDGKLYHYHKMGKVVLDGSNTPTYGVLGNKETSKCLQISYNTATHKPNGTMFCDTTIPVPMKVQIPLWSSNYTGDEGICFANTNGDSFIIRLKDSNFSTNLNSSTNNEIVNKFKQWLQENPTTVVYELAEPYYELISDDPLIVQSYAEGKLDTSSIISPTSIQFVPYEEELTYLYTSTQYCIQFNSTANCTVDITLGGTKVESKSVSVGLNKIYITTPSTLVDNKLIINAKGSATISEVVVVNSNAEFDYFDGLKSSFEDCLVTDVDSENYGKYEVGVKIVGKNKFDRDNITKVPFIHNLGRYIFPIKVKPNTQYTISCNPLEKINDVHLWLSSTNDLSIDTYFRLHPKFANSADFRYKTLISTANGELYFISNGGDLKTINTILSFMNNIQIEEGTTVTSYEPYKETNATIYLNSPLLQGDRIEVVDGKLCHYHKMGKVVLNGSEDWHVSNGITHTPSNYTPYDTPMQKSGGYLLVDKLLPVPGSADPTEHGEINLGNSWMFRIYWNKDLLNFKQWLQENPATVVYELAEPYYEDITPIQSSFVISTVSEGDMEIFTDLPIKSNITYLTNIASAVLMEQQLDELDNTESLTDIVEDEINE